MSWDADICGRSWNYTHNTNRMVNAAAKAAGYDLEGESWWRWLNGQTLASAQPFFVVVVDELEANPDTYRAMNPENGWGGYDTLCGVLREMRDVQVPPPPSTVWETWG